MSTKPARTPRNNWIKQLRNELINDYIWSLNKGTTHIYTLTNSIDYGTWRLNAAFTRDLQQPLSWAESTQFLVLIPIYLRYILILSSHLRLGLPKCLFSVGVPVKILKAFLPSAILITWPVHLNRLDLISDYIRWTVQTMKFLIVKPYPFPIRIPLGPKYSPQDPVFKHP